MLYKRKSASAVHLGAALEIALHHGQITRQHRHVQFAGNAVF